MGDLVTPGQEQENNTESLAANTNPPAGGSNNSNQGIGGNSDVSNQSQNNNSDSSSLNSNSNTNSSSGGGVQVNLFGLTFGNSDDGGEVLVAGAGSSDNQNNIVGGEKDKKININLAWLFLTLPIAAFIILRRKFGFVNSVIARGIHLFI